MKRNAITRIVIYSILILVLLGILGTGLGIGMFMVDLDIDDDSYVTTSKSGFSAIASDQIRNIEIEWVAGNITLITADTDSISFYEDGTFDENMEMVWKQSGDTLIIRYSKESLKLGVFTTISKDLTVTVPMDWACQSLSIETASAELTVDHWNAEEVELDAASGQCEFVECTIGSLDIDTASGSVHYSGVLDELDCDAASADFVGVLRNKPRSIQMDSASGDLDITIPEDCGFRVSMDSISSNFQSDYPTEYTRDCFVYADEYCQIDFDGASGGIRIRKP